ncbi:hypothetical protein M885DRAFT_294711 [Pelagophyceae sp. CCMP2097]|nr:hypothetical protein M885DRAFT_294711 [Pelagophyceae sp. CCMP2097]
MRCALLLAAAALRCGLVHSHTDDLKCRDNMNEGERIHGKSVQVSDDRRVWLERDGDEIDCDSEYVPGETLYAKTSSTSGEVLFELQEGATFAGGLCDGLQTENNQRPIKAPTDGSNLNLRIGWATKESTVYITEWCTLKECSSKPDPTRSPVPDPTKAPRPRPTKTPTYKPTKTPTPEPSQTPTYYPTKRATTPKPSAKPSSKPTVFKGDPSAAPIPVPTLQPTTKYPTMNPTTTGPSFEPSTEPTKEPTRGGLVNVVSGFSFELIGISVVDAEDLIGPIIDAIASVAKVPPAAVANVKFSALSTRRRLDVADYRVKVE